MNKKQTLYEILGVGQTAGTEEIRAAHRRRSFEAMTDKSAVGREDRELKLRFLDIARDTLVNSDSRDAYDAKLAPTQQNMLPTVRLGDGQTEQIAALVLQNHAAQTGLAQVALPLSEMVAPVRATGAALKTILRGVFLMLILLFVVAGSRSCMNSRVGQGEAIRDALWQADHGEVIGHANQKLAIQHYFKKHGVRLETADEVYAREREDRQLAIEQREAEFEARRQEEEFRRFEEESRRIGEQVHNDLIYAEEMQRLEDERARRGASEGDDEAATTQE